jgi:outer membrane protein OmpA-like peptidoglycan-associated protein
MRIFHTIVFLFTVFTATALEHDPPQGDTTVVDSLLTTEQLLEKDFPEICPDQPFEHWIYNPDFPMTPAYYKDRYVETDLMYKVVDNWGNGFDSLYGARNMRPILHGIAYRGGANNHYHKTDKRHNHNPLPNDGIENLCKEGFSNSVYLYRNNFDTAPTFKNCDCVNGAKNKMEYTQYDYFDDKHVYEMVEMVYKSATDTAVGPVYLHCWNGWHASGFISAVLLKQFCGYNDLEATSYWDLGTDGANNSPRYNKIRERIMNFQPISEFMINDSLGNNICPPMPEFIDSSQLHISIEHLAIVPEAIPVGTIMILENVTFGPGKTTLSNTSSNSDLKNLLLALNSNPDIKVQISGHTDKSGNEANNKTLSKKRAAYVYNYLIDKGISADRLTYKGYGSSYPAYSNRTKDGRAANRRIEIKILSKKAESMDKLVDEESIKKVEVLAEEEEEVTIDEITSKKVGDAIVFQNVIFAPGDTTIADSVAIELDKLVKILKENPEMKIAVIGYTDISGIPEKNIYLSNVRAKAVHDYILLNDIEFNRLSYLGKGSAKPIAPNAYRWGRDKNRRIEIELVQ